MNRKILSEVRVVDMTEGVAGPYAATLLGDMGADVIKIERREGDWQRSAGRGEPGRFGNPQFVALNRNKRDIGIDLNDAGGRGIVERLVSKADVVISNYRAGVMAKLGFGHERCQALKPDIIYCTVSGFGQDGAYAQLPASDTILQAVSGVMSVVGEPEGAPLRVGFPLIDMAAANYAVQSVLLALYGRLSGQGGAHIDVSLMAAAAALMCGGFTEYMASGRLPPRQGNQNSLLAPAGAFEVAGGRYITIAVLRDSHWKKFCAALGLEALGDDRRFASNAGRVGNRAALHALIVPLLKSKPSEYWLERLRAADILCGPINTVADVLADPALAACLPLLDTGLPDIARAMGAPMRYNGDFFAAERPSPAKGQHTREVLAEAGYTHAEIERLLEAGSAFVEAC
ncbi:MAG: CoA transferase [Burkholderiales bacterium]|jgi:crotonobetainyl-CoA:carnitine CoA-transferase CaiB-like acyl-CoA transferase|nr:CoA transferase [Burkholderiales bacterium]